MIRGDHLGEDLIDTRRRLNPEVDAFQKGAGGGVPGKGVKLGAPIGLGFEAIP